MSKPTDLDLLSRHLDGDLSADEARRLEERLGVEPELAARQQQLLATLDLLQELPAEEPVPPALHAQALAMAAPLPDRRRASRGPALSWGLAALAAAAALALAVRPPAPTRIAQDPAGPLLQGRTHLSLADGTTVDLDGRARLVPGPCPTCSPEAPVPLSLPQVLGGAAVGAALTVVVYEGRAVVTPGDGGPSTTVEAGQRHVLGGGAQPEAPVAAREAGPVTGAAASAEELDRLREENDRLRLENALVRGSLAAHEGAPIPWPEHVPEPLRPDGFAARVEAAVAGLEGLELLEVDCDEYPCLAVVRSSDVEPGWERKAQAVPEGLNQELGEGYGIVAMARGEDDGQEPIMMLAFGLVEASEDGPAEDPKRIGYRAEQVMHAAAEEIRDGATD